MARCYRFIRGYLVLLACEGAFGNQELLHGTIQPLEYY